VALQTTDEAMDDQSKQPEQRGWDASPAQVAAPTQAGLAAQPGPREQAGAFSASAQTGVPATSAQPDESDDAAQLDAPARTAHRTLLPIRISGRAVLFVMLAASFVTCAAQSMLSAALPSIMVDFSVDATLAQLLTTGYIYVLGILSVLTAFLINGFDSRKLFLASLSFFVVGSVLALLAPNYLVLLAARFLQAGGNGIMLPLIQNVAVTVYPKERHGFALGLVGMVIGFAPVIGPVFSGAIVQLWGWRTIFLILGSLSAIALLVSFLFVCNFGEHTRQVLDVKSCLLYIPGLIIMMLGVTLTEQQGLYEWYSYTCDFLGVVLLFVFCYRQLHIDHPVLKLSLFHGKHVLFGVLLTALAQIAMVTGTVQLPLYMQELHGLSALESGLILLPGSLLMAFASPVVGSFYDHHGMRVSATIGLSCLAVGSFGFTVFNGSTPIALIGAVYCVRMIGLAFLMMPMTTYALEKLSGGDVAHGTAIVNSLRQIGGSLGSSVLVATMTAATQQLDPMAEHASEGLSVVGLNASFGIQVAFALSTLVIVLVVVKPLKRKRPAA
jgi:EmrB/QacA subfamily drug resistance transporter